MAKISAHGKEIGTVYMLTSAKRYMSDGIVLKNQGFGWKIGGKLKPGVTPQQAYERQVQHQREMQAKWPCAYAYKAELHSLCGLSKRWKLHAAVDLMPDDPDGVWSEACDSYGGNVHADCFEIAELCRLYKAALHEAELIREFGERETAA